MRMEKKNEETNKTSIWYIQKRGRPYFLYHGPQVCVSGATRMEQQKVRWPSSVARL